MDYFNVEGTFDLPEDTTKKKMLEIYDEFDDYIFDEECDYLALLSGSFNLCVDFDVEAKHFYDFMMLLKKYNMVLTHVGVENTWPEYGSKMKVWCEELTQLADKGQDALCEGLKEFVKFMYPEWDWKLEDGIISFKE